MSLKGSAIKERVVHETTKDGRQVTKKIHTLEGSKFEEIEEYETTQSGEKKNVKYSKRTTPKSPAAEAALKALVSQEIVVVPGHTKIEFDESTNTKTITEKTTSGHQVTTIITFPDGRTKTQTRTFFDPISVPVDEEEYEEEEETEEVIEEDYIPSTQNTQVTNKQNVDQKQVKNTSNVSTVGEETKTSTQVKQVSQQQTTVTQQKSSKTTSETQMHSQSTKTQQTEQQRIQNTQNVDNKQIIQRDNNPNNQVAVPNQPRTTVVKKRLDTGEEIEIHTTVSADGLSKSCRRIVTNPAEEMEVTEYEETHTFIPGERKQVTSVQQQTSTKKVTQTSSQSVQSHQQIEQQHHTQQHHSQQQQHNTQQQIQQQTTKNQTNDRQLKTVDNQNIVPRNQDEFIAAQHSTMHTKVTESVTMIVQDEHGSSGVTKTKQATTNEQNVRSKQTGQKDVNTSQNQTTFTEEEHVLSQQEIERLLQQQRNTNTKQITQEISSLTKQQIDQLLQHHNNSKTTTQTTQKTSTLTQEQVEELKRLQKVKSTQQTTQQTTQQLTQKSQVNKSQIDKQEQEMRRQMEQQKQQTNVDERFTKNQNETISIEKHVITNKEKTFTTKMGHQVTRPETLAGEETTEEVRYFPGGVEYTWHTVRKDGSSKMSMRTFYDPVPIGEDEDMPGKKKLPAACASNADAGFRK